MEINFNIPYDDPSLYQPNIPLIFTDATELFDGIAKKYNRHTKGYYILGPSGVGKTHFISKQKTNDWMDGDMLWSLSHAHPRGKWWEGTVEEMTAIDSRADVITQEAIKYGFRIIGASNAWLRPDAIVIPDWEAHKQWIIHREKNNYDGGATSNDFEQVIRHRDIILEHEKTGVPRFYTVKEAVTYLESQ